MRHVISSKVSSHSLLAVASADDYARGVEAAGGLPVVLPYAANDTTVLAWAERLDGLLLAGGEDVNPLLYGEQPKLGLAIVVPERDDIELQLVHAMVQSKKPVFGICRGIQVLAAAFGGSLYQELSREWRGKIAHRQKAPRDHLSHRISVKPDTRLSSCLGGCREIFCNSFHHQAVRDVPADWEATAWDDDGLVEAMEHAAYPFLVGVQWHPENLWSTHSEFLGLFTAFVDAARTSTPDLTS